VAQSRRSLLTSLGRHLPGCVLSEATNGVAALQRVMVQAKHWSTVILDSEIPVRLPVGSVNLVLG
jgi:hypothetical protein